MKVDALRILGKGKIDVAKVELEEPNAIQVQVEIQVCGICAWDGLLFDGKSLFEEYPLFFGHEGVGVITKVGNLVQGYKVGDKVFCAGGALQMAQAVNIDPQFITKIPQAADPYMWIGEPVACVVNGIDQIEITPGDNVALVGAGFMGLLNVQGLSNTLLGNLTVFDLDPKKLELAKEFGANEIYQVGTKEADEKIVEFKRDGGFNIVIESSGSSKGLELADCLLATTGKLSLFGWQKGTQGFDGTKWHLNGYRVYNSAPMSDKHYQDRLPQAAKLMNRGIFNLEKLITHTADYKNASQTFEIASSKADGYIKGAIKFN